MSNINDASKANRTDESIDFPKVVLIDNCSACNLRCSMCDHENIKEYRKIQLMDMTLYKKIIDEIAVENPNIRIWNIFFGDPFICHDMDSRVRYAKKKGLTDVVLNSNGVLMTPERASSLIDAGLDAMYVGIDAACKDTYDKIRIGGDFDLVVNNVLGYRDLLSKYGRSEQKIYVQFVSSEFNKGEEKEFEDFWTNNGVNVKIRPKVSWAGLIEANNLLNNNDIDRKPCYWIMQTMNICADGRVALCSADLHCREECGDVTEVSLKEIWQKGKHAKYRRMHRESRFEELPDICRNCSDWQSAYAEFKTSRVEGR